MIKNIIFDVGDTLATLKHHKTWVSEQVAAQYGVPVERVEAFWREMAEYGNPVHGVTVRWYWPHKKTDLGPIPVEAMEAAAKQHSNDVVLNVEMLALLAALKPRYRLFALSNTWRFWVRTWPELDSCFEDIVRSHVLGIRKPDPRAYRYVLETYGLKPEETLFVDNHQPHVEGARAVGMHAVQFTGVEQLKKDLTLCGVSLDTPKTRGVPAASCIDTHSAPP